jgi:predicted flavoprotein YhiN
MNCSRSSASDRHASGEYQDFRRFVIDEARVGTAGIGARRGHRRWRGLYLEDQLQESNFCPIRGFIIFDIHKYDALILGGGAAGLMCAIEAGKRGRRVAVLEHSERLGKKILISGGGRCNFTNVHCSAESFISANPHFAKSALARYTPADFIALVEKHRIPYHEKTLGQLFCDRSAQDILDMLEKEYRESGVQLFPRTAIHKVARTDESVATVAEHEFRAPALVVATGGLSIPKMGPRDSATIWRDNSA